MSFRSMRIGKLLKVLFLIQVNSRSSAAVFQSQTYNLQDICSLEYGVVLSSSPQPTIVMCASRCMEHTACLSFVYNMTSSECAINSMENGAIITGCVETVKYGKQVAIPPSTTTTSVPSPTGHGATTTTTTTTTEIPALQDIGGACIDMFDCADPLSDCIGEVCTCISGYVYDTNLHQCVFILDCQSHGGNFQMLTDHTYSGNADQYLPSVTLNDCISACIDSVGFICRLIHYFAYTCYLHSLEQQSAISISSMTTSAVGNTVLERDCAIPAPSIGISCVADTDCWETDSMCNQGFCECRNGYSYDFEHQRCAPGCFVYNDNFGKFNSHRVLGFLADKEKFQITSVVACRDICLTDIDIFCVSAIYDLYTQTCQLSSQSFGIYPNESFVPTEGLTLLQRNCHDLTLAMQNSYCWNSGCPAMDSQCRDGVCKCPVGRRYDVDTDACVTACADYRGKKFQTELGLYFEDVSYITHQMTSNTPEAECKGACADDTLCLMATLYLPTLSCSLSSADVANIPAQQHLVNPSYNTFIRVCKQG